MVSEAEKRQILRERRAAKFAKAGGSDRLNKITGTNNSQLSTHSPIGSKSPTPTPQQTPTPVQKKNTSKRISQTFATSNSSEKDPDIVDISTMAPRLADSPIADPLNDLQQQPNDEDLQKILQQMLSGAVPQSHHHDPSSADDGATDPFGGQDFFKQMMAAAGGSGGGSGAPGVDPTMASMFGDSAAGNGSPMGANNTRYQEIAWQYQNFKTYFTIARFITLFSLLIFASFTHHLESSSIKIDYENGFALKFQYIFIALEIMFFTIHFVNLQKYDVHPGGGILNSILPLASNFIPPTAAKLLKMVSSYMDFYKILQTDISLVVLYFGLLSIL